MSGRVEAVVRIPSSQSIFCFHFLVHPKAGSEGRSKKKKKIYKDETFFRFPARKIRLLLLFSLIPPFARTGRRDYFFLPTRFFTLIVSFLPQTESRKQQQQCES